METQQIQNTFSGGHPNLAYPDIETENYHLRFRFEYGNLDDGTIWIRTPRKSLFQIDWLTLRLLLELNAGMPFIPLCRKYKVNLDEMRGLLINMKKEGAIVSHREGKITQATQEDDIHMGPFVFLFILLAVIQIEYFQNIASTYRLRNWQETLLIGIFSIMPIVLHEFGHYLSSKPYFPARLGFTFMLFFPAVYIDTHSAWCLPRNIRLLINSSGLLMDLGFNTLLVILVIYFPWMEYYVTPLLVLQYTRWSIIMNPLVKGDGYWLLADFSKTVNLHRKAKEYFRNRRVHWLSLYGLFSILFLVFSILGLIWFILNLFRFGILFK